MGLHRAVGEPQGRRPVVPDKRSRPRGAQRMGGAHRDPRGSSASGAETPQALPPGHRERDARIRRGRGRGERRGRIGFRPRRGRAARSWRCSEQPQIREILPSPAPRVTCCHDGQDPWYSGWPGWRTFRSGKSSPAGLRFDIVDGHALPVLEVGTRRPSRPRLSRMTRRTFGSPRITCRPRETEPGSASRGSGRISVIWGCSEQRQERAAVCGADENRFAGVARPPTSTANTHVTPHGALGVALVECQLHL